jgi:hypothetical protein
MWHNYKIIVIAGGMLLPYVVFAYRNRFNNAVFTFSRGVLAVVIGWAYVLGCTLMITDIDMRLAKTQQEMQFICDHDGGHNVGVLLIGWFPPLFLVFVYWVVHRIIIECHRTNESSSAST